MDGEGWRGSACSVNRWREELARQIGHDREIGHASVVIATDRRLTPKGGM